jgi:hypothetical protein
MCNFKYGYSKSIASVVMMVLMATSSYGASCDVLGGRRLHDGQLFYRVAGALDWTEMPDAGVSLGNVRSEFIYIVDETFEAARAGVVILKTGRIRQAGEEQPNPQAKTLRLVRHFKQFDNGSCGNVTDFGKASVSPKSYDDYHDVGRATVDDATLDSFHFKYAARRNGCHTTNSKLGDTLSPYARSNRGQFSFDTDVVDFGTYYQILVLAHVETASAASEKLAAQRVETRQYRVVRGRPECVSFKYRVPPGTAFLRINDLEALSDQGGSTLKRAMEHRWPLASR